MVSYVMVDSMLYDGWKTVMYDGERGDNRRAVDNECNLCVAVPVRRPYSVHVKSRRLQPHP